MKKIIILALSLFLGTQTFAFSMNVTGSASSKGNTTTAMEVKTACTITMEYNPVCAIVDGEKEPKTFGNKSEAKCKNAKIVHDGNCESASVKAGKDSDGEKVVGFQGLQVEARPRSTDTAGFDSEVVGSKKMPLHDDPKFELDSFMSPEDTKEIRAQLQKDINSNDDSKIELHAEVKFSSNEAREKATLGGQVDVATEVKLENDDDGKVYYSVKGEKKAKFLGLFTVNMNVEAKVDAERGEVIEVETPWYSIFLF